MNYVQADKKLKELSLTYFSSEPKEWLAILEQMEEILEEYLKEFPQDITMRARLAMCVYEYPMKDWEKGVKCLEEILEYDPHNIQALLAIAYIMAQDAVIDNILAERLKNALNWTITNEQRGLIYHALAWHIRIEEDIDAYQSYLLQSTEVASKLVKNHIQLGRLYQDCGYEDLGSSYIVKGLKNIVSIDHQYPDKDITSLEEFFNIYPCGTHISRVNYECALERLDPYWVNPLKKALEEKLKDPAFAKLYEANKRFRPSN